ncbi:MAG: hypothetical protein F2529_01445 [Actinobacteria bacterium]|jgi:hypothetical protein|uniref:Unannotated protein n=1 Tax=freshwater metagenome TaxID=449393 RepID=A0A6J6BDE8_9ZZZZ|nr:hypothetical protein [Actinomycetota bacterium]MTA29553.1 hypothetical protein [Actinomycetota bacterium]
MKQGWSEIIPIWVVVAIATVGITFLDRQVALVWAGAILAGSLAVVSLIHLFKEDVDGFVRKLIYVAGGSFLMLSTASLYLLLT